jgi:hypothetical protein
MSTPESTAVAEGLAAFQSRFDDPSPSNLSWGHVRALRAKVRQLAELQAAVSQFLSGGSTLADLMRAAGESEAVVR